MKTKREILEEFVKDRRCVFIDCTDCAYQNNGCGRGSNTLYHKLCKIGAMAILRQSKRKFDPNKVLTCVTADKAKVGMKGYFGDDLAELKCNFKNNYFHKLLFVNEEYYAYRFKSEINDYALFYPIDEVEE